MSMNRRIFMGTVASIAAAFNSVGAAFKNVGKKLINSNKVGDGVCVDEKEDIWEFKVLRADRPDSNKCVYSKSLLEKLVYKQQYAQVVTQGNIGMPNIDQFFGENNDFVIYDVDNASHTIKSLEVKGEYLVARIQPSWYTWTSDKGPEYTHNGIRLRSMLHSNTTPITMRIVGVGNLEKEINGIKYVGENFQILGINAVHIDEAVKL